MVVEFLRIEFLVISYTDEVCLTLSKNLLSVLHILQFPKNKEA